MGRRAGLTTETVLAAAAALADRVGFAQLTITGLASDLEVKPPSLYNHVSGLDEIRLALAVRAADELGGLLQTACEGCDPEEAIRRMCHGYRQFALDHPGLYEAHTRGTQLTDDAETLERLRRPMLPAVVAMQELDLDREATIHAIRAFRGTVQGFLELETGDAFRTELAVDESFDRAVELFVSGLRDWKS